MNKRHYELVKEIHGIIGSLNVAEDVLKEIMASVESPAVMTGENSMDILDELHLQQEAIQNCINELLRVLVKCYNIRKNTQPEHLNKTSENFSNFG